MRTIYPSLPVKNVNNSRGHCCVDETKHVLTRRQRRTPRVRD